MRKLNSPSPFRVPGNKAPRDKRVYLSSLIGRNKRMTLGRAGCYLAIFVMLGASAMLALSAADRAVGTAWGGLLEASSPGDFVLPASGFIVVEMADAFAEEELCEEETDLGFLYSSKGRSVEPCLLPLTKSNAEPPADEPQDREKESQRENLLVADGRPESGSGWSFSQFFGGGIADSTFTSGSGNAVVVGFDFPEHLVQEGGQYGGSGLGSGFGVSRMTVFQPRSTHGLSSGESSFSTANGALFASSAVSCSPFSKEAQKSGAEVSDSSASDYETVILSVGEDGGKMLVSEEDLGEESEEVLLAEVSVLWKEHVVKLGQTLSDIATAHGVSMNDIMKANELKNANRLSEKQILLIPNDSSAVEATLEQVLTRKARLVAAREKVLPIKITAYVVSDGDSLWSISNSQNLEIDTLIGCNDIRNINVIRPGVTLRVPNQDGVFYKVKKGDTLAGIGKKYSVAADRIKEANGQAVEPLVADKEIFLPGARPETSQVASQTKAGGTAKVTAASRNYRWPVVGKINSPFGWRRHPITRRRDFHTGIDIKSPRGRAIHASRAGVVDYSGWMGGYGKVVVINHGDGNSTLYAHCSTVSVRKGQRISQGQAIAAVGTTGRTTGPHLHFEIRRGNSPVNPLGLLK